MYYNRTQPLNRWRVHNNNVCSCGGLDGYPFSLILEIVVLADCPKF